MFTSAHLRLWCVLNASFWHSESTGELTQASSLTIHLSSLATAMSPLSFGARETSARMERGRFAWVFVLGMTQKN